MKHPKLIVMAAGLGSRYGGLKQMEPITDENEIILDFAVFDAVKAGFQDIIFVIKPEMEAVFTERVLNPMKRYANVSYVFQELHQLPEGYTIPEGRVKPWGTCHAVMACREHIDGPFAVINADDYYGKDAFVKVYDFLCENTDSNAFCMAGYYVENTLSEQGTVTRGVCKTDEDANLTEIVETKNIGWNGEAIEAVDEETGQVKSIEKGTVVSMNFWGFTEKMMEEMERNFPVFLNETIENNPLKGEYLLPIEVGKMIEANQISVKVLEAVDKWYGVTYKEDRELVYDAFRKMKEEGKYPQKLWP